MPRSRELKYSFFTDEEIAQLGPWARLLFEGLWCLADCDGRLEDRPLRIKAMVFPYDTLDIEALLDELDRASGDFIQRYEVDGKKYIQVRTLKKNQHFHPKERPAGFPSPPARKIPGKPETSTASNGEKPADQALPSLSSLPSEISGGISPRARDPYPDTAGTSTATTTEQAHKIPAAYDWLCFFKSKHREKTGRDYGKGEQDSKALGRLADLLGSFPEQQRLDDWGVRERIVIEFLSRNDSKTISAGWSFAFFVTDFGALAIDPSKRPKREKRRPGQPEPYYWPDATK